MPLGTVGNIQELKQCFSRTAQTNAATASTTNLISMLKNDRDFFASNLSKEDDAPEIGKGHEFATQTFAAGWTLTGRVSKFLSSEWLALVAAYSGTSTAASSGAGYTHTMSPESASDFVTNGIEPAYLSVIEQVRPGGNAIIDRLYTGVAIEGFQIDVKAGIGRGNSTITADFVGTGAKTEPSGVSIPTLTQPHELPAGSISCVLNGFDYASSKLFESLTFSYKRNLQPRYVGGGTQSASPIAPTATIATGAVTAITGGGSGWTTVPSAVAISGGGGSGATATVALSSGSLVFTVTGAGTGYTSAPTVALTGGVQGGVGVIAGAIEIGTRVLSLGLTARFVKGSPELALLGSLSSGTGTIGLTGANIGGSVYHSATLALAAVQYKVAQVTAIGDRIGIQIDIDPLYDNTNGLFTLTTTNAIAAFGKE